MLWKEGRPAITQRCLNPRGIDNVWRRTGGDRSAEQNVLVRFTTLDYASQTESSQIYVCLFLSNSPNKKCAAFYNLSKVLADGDSSFHCTRCNERLCARCRTSHLALSCEQFQSLPADERNMEDLALFDIAKRSYYARCNHCLSFVEKIVGCSHIVCRCGHEFCYVRQRYQGPTAPVLPATSQTGTNNFLTTPTGIEATESAYTLEEAPCTHEWQSVNRVLDRPRLCHLCRQTKRCFQSYCTKCRLRACAICLKSALDAQKK